MLRSPLVAILALASTLSPNGPGASAAETPGPVFAWPAGPMEVRVAFDGPIGPEAARGFAGRSILGGDLAELGDPSNPGRASATRGRVGIAAARLVDEGRTLVLETDPHSWAGSYLLPLPLAPDSVVDGAAVELPYDLSGAEATWEGKGDRASIWWPSVATKESRALTEGSVEHERFFKLLDRPGRLSLRTFAMLPSGKVNVRLESDVPLEATLAYEAPSSTGFEKGRHRAEWALDATGQAVEVALAVTTGTEGRAPTVSATFQTEADPKQRTLWRAWQTLPWAPTPISTASESVEITPLPFSLTGGDATRGEAVFFSEEARCSACHKVRGRGGEVGPVLDGLSGRDPAEIYREIAAPSVVIHPDDTPYAVALRDGRIAVGIVRAEGADAVRVLDTDGKETRFDRDQIEELRPSSTSIMPEGLAAALGEARMRDLLTFLVAPAPGEPGRSKPEAIAQAARETSAPRMVATLPKLGVEVAFPNLVFDRPVTLAYPEDGSDRLFVEEQKGIIWSFPNDPGTADRATFLDIRTQVLSPASGGGNEEGLLGLAFHPRYRDNGQFFVYYSAKEGPTGRRSVVSRFRAARDEPGRADPASEERIWASQPDPYGNHNGGCIAFGPDGFLYISLGDSGSADDPLTTGQDPKDWFGSILRIDVDHPADGERYGIPADNPARRNPRFRHWAPEVYCIGLRNVWKFTFDREAGTLWAGDVGQNLWEEVDVIENGGNYGWSLAEGFHPFRPRQAKDRSSPLSSPMADYPHNPNQAGSRRPDHGLSITGGYVYRGKALPWLVGVYVYADYQTGRIWGLRPKAGKAVPAVELFAPGRGSSLNVAAFGEDPAGELFLLAFDGKIYRLVPGG